MDSQRDLAIAALETAIASLQEHKRRIQSVISSDLSSPELKAQARVDLIGAVKDLTDAALPLARLANNL
jgi:hypothetical protein